MACSGKDPVPMHARPPQGRIRCRCMRCVLMPARRPGESCQGGGFIYCKGMPGGWAWSSPAMRSILMPARHLTWMPRWCPLGSARLCTRLGSVADSARLTSQRPPIQSNPIQYNIPNIPTPPHAGGGGHGVGGGVILGRLYCVVLDCGVVWCSVV
jgi:hypothetical protein